MSIGWCSSLGYQIQWCHTILPLFWPDNMKAKMSKALLICGVTICLADLWPPRLCGPNVTAGHRYLACFPPGEISYHHTGSPCGDLFQKALEYSDTVTVWEKGMSFYVVYKRIEWPQLCHNSTDWNVYCRLPESWNSSQGIFRSWSWNAVYFTPFLMMVFKLQGIRHVFQQVNNLFMPVPLVWQQH